MNVHAQALQNWAMNLDRRLYALIVGLIIGISAGGLSLALALLGPLITIIGIVAVLVALYVLTDVRIALYGSLTLMLLLPFGTLPFRIGLTPTLLDLSLGAFIVVYLLQWIKGRYRRFKVTPVHAFITIYVMWLIFAFFMGMRYGNPSATILRQFASVLLSISLTFILVDLLRTSRDLRQLTLVITVIVGLQALIAIFLWILPDQSAESILVRLARIGYPDGGVIRYIEQNPDLPERAIGTWIDPNALGGMLAIGAAMITPQIFATRPVLRYRWLTLTIVGTICLALLLSSSRASFLALATGLSVIAFIRYRRFIPILLLAGSSLLILPATQNYIDRILQAFQGQDLATQMRIGEWTDSLELISQYPFFGIGFTGTPDNTVYTDVANMYLIMANQIGLTGVAIFLIAMSAVFIYGAKAWRYAKHDQELEAIHLGFQVALLTALTNAVADLYFFRLDFQSSITWFWITVTLALASSHIVRLRASENTGSESAVALDPGFV